MRRDSQPQLMPVKVLNPGLSRSGLEERAYVWALETSVVDDGARATMPLENVYADAWAKLQWWESQIQARKGIEGLCRLPFIDLRRSDDPSREALIPTGKLYQQAIRSTERPRVEDAARYVVAAVRQAREYYSAATNVGVSALTKPVLYFYGALALARAAVVAVFGTEALEFKHGLRIEPGPSLLSLENGLHKAGWPTLIKWEGYGDFAAFYRATRWDKIYGTSLRNAPNLEWPTFHILECLRFLKCEWGSLPPAVDWPPRWAGTQPQVRMLMPFMEGEGLYLRDESEIRQRAMVLAPQVIVQYMVLRYFADLARYHPTAWQALLEGATDLEGYVFRAAIDRVAQEYVCEMTMLLPHASHNRSVVERKWTTGKFVLEDWFTPPSIVVGAPHLTLHTYELKEWTGDDTTD